jgi:hypothetical protein
MERNEILIDATIKRFVKEEIKRLLPLPKPDLNVIFEDHPCVKLHIVITGVIEKRINLLNKIKSFINNLDRSQKFKEVIDLDFEYCSICFQPEHDRTKCYQFFFCFGDHLLKACYAFKR